MTAPRAEHGRPRLLVLASTYPRWIGDHEPGFVHHLSSHLARRFDVTVLCPHAPGAASREAMDGVRVVRYRYAPERFEVLVNDGGIVTNLKRHPWKWLLVPGFILCLALHAFLLQRRWRPAVIHAHWLLPQGLVAALAGMGGGVPFVVTSHGADLYALRSRPLQALKRFVVRRASAVTVVSEAMREELGAIGAGTGNAQVRPMGVDLRQRFTPDPAQPRNDHEILFVGRLVEKKGLRDLVDAMPAVLDEHPRAILTVAGFGPEEPERREQVARLGLEGCVRFLGPVPQAELPALYRRAALLAAPFVATAEGDREGLGLILVEALGCGCPVVTTRLPSAREVFGETPAGELVEPGSPAALAGRIRRMLAAPDQARARAMELRGALLRRFDWGAVSDAYACVLEAASGTRP